MEFKVGDWVVLDNVVSTETSLAQILKTDGRWSIVKWLEDDTESNIRLDFLRHATPEEINAGHRLDHFVAVNDMGDDAHIENHISPNCRINCFQDDTEIGTRTVDIEAENERLKTENLAMQAEIDDLQKRLDAVKLDLSIFSDFIKRFDANTDTATIVGTLYGFVDELEQSLGGEA